MAEKDIKCIKQTFDNKAKKKVTWCGKTIHPFLFTFDDVTQAADNGAQGLRFVVCHECTQAVYAALLVGSEHEQIA
jgi:hypothetical protein